MTRVITLAAVLCAFVALTACSSNCGYPSTCAPSCAPPCAPYGAAPAYGPPPSYGATPGYSAPSMGAPIYEGAQPYGGTAGTASQSGNVVTVQNHAYSPATLTVTPGTTVRWVNRDSVAHTATGNGFDVELPPGGQGSYTFAAPGTYAVHCRYHERMRAQIVVR